MLHTEETEGLVGKPDEKRPPEIPILRQQDNIKWILNWLEGREPDCSGPGHG